MWLALLGGMGFATSTIEMRTPEEHRERLHLLVKAARRVLVLSSDRRPGASRAAPNELDPWSVELARTGDDTTMYVVGALDRRDAAALTSGPTVTVVVPGDDCAVFAAEAVVSRDRALIDELWSEAWRAWCHG